MAYLALGDRDMGQEVVCWALWYTSAFGDPEINNTLCTHLLTSAWLGYVEQSTKLSHEVLGPSRLVWRDRRLPGAGAISRVSLACRQNLQESSPAPSGGREERSFTQGHLGTQVGHRQTDTGQRVKRPAGVPHQFESAESSKSKKTYRNFINGGGVGDRI